MSEFSGINRIIGEKEKVSFIVPERIREACGVRGLNYKEAAERCSIPYREFGMMANGHIENIPKDYIFRLAKGLDFPGDFFYYIQWERI